MIRLPDNSPFGNYTVHRFIKEGLFNDSYIIKDGAGTPYFMKLFDLSRVPDKLLQDGIVAEIAHCRRISHPNIIQYVADGAGTINGRSFQNLVTKFFGGKLLSEVQREGRVFSVPEAKAIILPILEGLVYLHRELGLNHNDITPRNILLESGPDGSVTPKIIDLGHTHPDVTAAAPFPMEDLNVLYLAPEALTGVFTDKSDAFSATALYYTLLYGRAPWQCNISPRDSFYSRKMTVSRAREAELIFPKNGPDDTKIMALLDIGLQPDSVTRPAPEILHRLISEGCAPETPALFGEQTAKPRQKPDKPEGKAEVPEEKSEPRMDETTLTARKNKPGQGGFADVAGMTKLKQELINRVIWVLKDKEKAARYRLMPPNGMLLYGPPGCGKTFFAKKFAEESGFNYYLVNGSDLGSTYIHGTQGKIADLFKKAEQNAPTVICFDEFDSFVPARGSESARNRSEEVNEFLSQLNNCAERGIFVIGTTNRMDMIDPAVLRKGRMDLKYEIPAPDTETRRAMFELYLKGRPLGEGIDLDRLAALTDNYASSDIAFIVNESAMLAALSDEPLSQRILEESIHCNPSSLSAAPKRPVIGFNN